MATGFPIIFGSKTPLWTPARTTTALWLDAADSSTITLNGSTVSQWADKSGNGRNATQATAANQPTYNITGYNNKPAIRFDGANDVLNMTDGSVPTGDSNYSMFIVVSFNAVADAMMIGRVGGAGGTGSACYLGVIGGAIMGNWWAGTGVSVDSPVANTKAFYDFVYNNSISTITAVRNGTVVENFVAPFDRISTAPQQSIGGDVVNNARYFNGSFAEAIIIHGAASTTTRQQIEGYLAWKWLLQDNLSSDHPYKNFPPTA